MSIFGQEAHIGKYIDTITLSYAYKDLPIWKMREIWSHMPDDEKFLFAELTGIDQPSFQSVKNSMNKFVSSFPSLLELLSYMKLNETIDFKEPKIFTDKHTDVFVRAQSYEMASALVKVLNYIVFFARKNRGMSYTDFQDSITKGQEDIDLETMSKNITDEPVHVTDKYSEFRVHDYGSIIYKINDLLGLNDPKSPRDLEESAQPSPESSPRVSRRRSVERSPSGSPRREVESAQPSPESSPRVSRRRSVVRSPPGSPRREAESPPSFLRSRRAGEFHQRTLRRRRIAESPTSE